MQLIPVNSYWCIEVVILHQCNGISVAALASYRMCCTLFTHIWFSCPDLCNVQWLPQFCCLELLQYFSLPPTFKINICIIMSSGDATKTPCIWSCTLICLVQQAIGVACNKTGRFKERVSLFLPPLFHVCAQTLPFFWCAEITNEEKSNCTRTTKPCECCLKRKLVFHNPRASCVSSTPEDQKLHLANISATFLCERCSTLTFGLWKISHQLSHFMLFAKLCSVFKLSFYSSCKIKQNT